MKEVYIMQIILRNKKEIHYATEIEKILKAMYPNNVSQTIANK